MALASARKDNVKTLPNLSLLYHNTVGLSTHFPSLQHSFFRPRNEYYLNDERSPFRVSVQLRKYEVKNEQKQ